jgi:putative transposase
MIDEALTGYPRMPLKELCELFGVSRSWYYEKPSSQQKASEDVELRDAIERIVLEFPGYGYRRVTEALKRQGWCINHKKVLRVMRKEALLCQLKKRFRPTTDSAHSFGIYPNLIKDAALDAPDQGWVADITYVRLPTTFCYLASILDDYSRYCVGWSLRVGGSTRG